MPKLILKAVSSSKSAASAAVDQVVGQVDTASGAQRLSISAQANTQYRLVDSKTGQVIKNQTVVRKGKTLQIEVDGQNVAELDDFFPEEASSAASASEGVTYVVDTSATVEPSYGLVTAQSPVSEIAGKSSVVWTTGMQALPLTEPVAFGAQALSALSGVGNLSGLGLVAGAAAVGYNDHGDSQAGADSSTTASITGSVFKAEVANNTGLVVEAFDSTGKSRGKANVGADGTYSLALTTSVTLVNDAPTGANNTVTVLEDGSKSFTAADFGFIDAKDGNTLSAVIITTLPSAGTLTLNGTAVNKNQSIAAADLSKLVYTPAANANGSNYATIGFKVQDNGGGADISVTANTLTINVTAVNDAPSGTVTVSGSVSVNSLLSAYNTLTDVEGLGTISYKWETQPAAGGAWTQVGTAQTYKLVALDSGKKLRVSANYTDRAGNSESVPSTTFTVVAAETQAPRLKNITLLSNAVSLTFDEALIGSTAMPDAITFSLNKYDSSRNATLVTVTGVEHPTDAQNNPVNDQFHIKFATQTLVDAYMKLSYTDPSRAVGLFSADDPNALQDSTGNDMPNFNVVVYNNSKNSEAGTTSIDYIMGGGGNDNIRGNSGNDVLWGNGTNGSGSDNDTFIWNLNDQGGSGATDVIKDFVRWNGTSGDKLSIYPLLTGFTNATSTLSDWVKTVAINQTVNGVANSTVMTIDVDGSGGAGTVTQVIQFEGVNLLSGVTGANLTDQLSRLQSDGVFTA